MPPPRKPATVRFTVRLPTGDADRLVELGDRLDRYMLRPSGYLPAARSTRTLVMPKGEHEFLMREAAAAGLSISGFIAKILEDPSLGAS